ncbi:DUF2721 domain-containing protein [Aestuariibacter halophilus]|uniref:DUF2721 domain-containing protein n=1 Tax=Fluctibacter halophilus TaxID=226011 RepID=A0ABS8GCG8_9ALTE|nr:DUF2721 domain-containing protein [Aestuariibacter halophilus]MCC2618208.1 DUF2721 domain-containing protein [Aestuariibacter halophilus]
MEFDPSITTLAAVIQIAVAPVFLLAGIAGFLNVMSGRLGRIVDRARVIERKAAILQDDARLPAVQYELRTLWRRIKIINWSIGMCTASGLMVCSVVVCLFIADFWHLPMDQVIVVMFVLALLLLISALVLFLKEVQLATRILQKGRSFIDD